MSDTLKIPTPDEIKAVKGRGFLLDKTTGRHFNARVITVNGKLTAEKMTAVAEAAKRFGSGEVAMTVRLTLEVQHIPFESIEPFTAFLAEHGLKTGGTGPKVRPIVSCKGTTCGYGLIDTFGLSEQLHTLFYEGYHNVTLPHKFKIAVGGCPNNCAKPDLNDLGVIGQRVYTVNKDACRACKKCAIESTCPIGAGKVEDGKINLPNASCNRCGRCFGKCPFGVLEEARAGYKITLGGKWGKKTAVGRPLSVILTDEAEVLRVVEGAILFFKAYGVSGERFGDTLDRVGFERAEAMLLSGELLSRKTEILGG